ncbi:MAG TPA: hypothetical protein VK920_03735, partial [Solirubrobacterales bacterium]|nr:hypothetical protein [Solirubrobacterales bacterium]
MGGDRRLRGEAGQGTVEWIGLVLLVALLLAALVVAGPRVPGGALARAIAERIVCAVRLSDVCGDDPELERAYGAEMAALAAEHAPRIRYERGMTALPVDYRRCREDACSRGAPAGAVWRSTSGEPVVAFVHVIDCRATAIARTRRAGADCSGPRRGNVYLQYWFYYAGSATAEGRVIPGAIRDISEALGAPSHHRDDWESYQVRIRPGSADARASAHHGYVYDLDGGWRPRVGSRPDGSPMVRPPWPKEGWGPETRTLYVSGGSHAGNARALRGVQRVTP